MGILNKLFSFGNKDAEKLEDVGQIFEPYDDSINTEYLEEGLGINVTDVYSNYFNSSIDDVIRDHLSKVIKEELFVKQYGEESLKQTKEYIALLKTKNLVPDTGNICIITENNVTDRGGLFNSSVLKDVLRKNPVSYTKFEDLSYEGWCDLLNSLIIEDVRIEWKKDDYALTRAYIKSKFPKVITKPKVRGLSSSVVLVTPDNMDNFVNVTSVLTEIAMENMSGLRKEARTKFIEKLKANGDIN